MIFKNSFNKPVFYKDSTELEKQITILKKLHEQYPKNEKIANDLRKCELGLKGEQNIKFELEHANIGMYVLHDVNVCIGDLKAQIDYILITPGYRYFIECKNYAGTLIVNERGDFIREYYSYGKKHKEGIYSPYTQAERHISIFNKIWQNRHNALAQKLFQDNFNKYNKPLVVLANYQSIIDVRKAPKHIKDNVVRSDYLVSLIKKDISSFDKDLLSSEEQMKKDAYSIMANYYKEVHKDYEAEYMKLIDNSNNEIEEKEILKNRLLEFRSKKSKERNIPLDYIFTDNELEKIIEFMPKTKEQLIFLNILPKVKLDLHGEEIISIILNNRTSKENL